MNQGTKAWRTVWVCVAVMAAAPWAPGVAALEHTFRLDTTGWPDQPETVNVAGTFNQWSRDANAMRRNADGLWEATLDLDEGVYLYKFVLNGGHWMKDPVYSDASLEEPDGHGGMNAAVLIGRDIRDLGPPEPDAIKAEVLKHDAASFKHLSVVSRDLLLLAVDTYHDDVQDAYAHVLQEDAWHRAPLSSEGQTLGLETYVGLVRTTLPAVAYFFELRDGEAVVYLGANGPSADESVMQDDAFTVEMKPSFSTPDWAKHAVWYQVFPERFRNGDPSNDPGDMPYETLLPWTGDWWRPHTKHGEAAGEDNFYNGAGNVWNRRYGGDLQGVRESLPYLKELGINAIYLNPIFEAESMHKYDTADFRHVDDNFGVRDDTPAYPPSFEGETDDPATWQWSPSDLVFLEFLKEAHAQGFKVVIDGVFNHVGRAHPFFRDVLAKGPESKYADWFEITDWGDEEHWQPMDDPFAVHGKEGGIQWIAWDQTNGHLPVFKNDPETGLADGPRQHIFDITRRWLDPDGDGDPSDGIDGWRLDVPGDIAHPFWIEWRGVVKGVNPDAYITGEIWQWAHPWLRGDQFDAVMNYQFAMPTQDFFVDRETAIAPSVYAQRLSRVVYNYPMQVALAQMNLMDSHDTDRFASMFVNPDRPYDGENRIQDNGPDYNPRKPNATERKRQMQAAALQATFVGAPMIYYGTEAGMWSPDDPSNRMPMVWEDHEPYQAYNVKFDPQIFAGYQRLFALRSALPVLRVGGFRVIHTDDEAGVLAFQRHLGDDVVYVVVNRSATKNPVALPVDEGIYINALSERSVGVAVSEAGPVLFRAPGAALMQPANGTIGMTLPAFGTVVLIPYDAIPTEDEVETVNQGDSEPGETEPVGVDKATDGAESQAAEAGAMG